MSNFVTVEGKLPTIIFIIITIAAAIMHTRKLYPPRRVLLRFPALFFCLCYYLPFVVTILSSVIFQYKIYDLSSLFHILLSKNTKRKITER